MKAILKLINNLKGGFLLECTIMLGLILLLIYFSIIELHTYTNAKLNNISEALNNMEEVETNENLNITIDDNLNNLYIPEKRNNDFDIKVN